MGALDDLIATDAAIFTDSTMMPGAETVTYTKVSGATRSIGAQVFRDPPVAEGSTTRALIRIEVQNNATTGILSSEINTGGDTITIAYRKGETAVARRIRRTLDTDSEDSAWLKLELE